MAPSDWGTGGGDSQYFFWCNVSTSVSTSTGIGTGAANTITMDAACSSGAGQAAADYVIGVYADWFLPSKDEPNAMYNHKSSIIDTAKFGFSTGGYWSSSQAVGSGGINAWYQSFLNGQQIAKLKLQSPANIRVRPIRAF